MLKVFKDTTTGATWDTFYKYDNQGREIWQASPSFADGSGEMLTLLFLLSAPLLIFLLRGHSYSRS
jgi:hypothetical protein